MAEQPKPAGGGNLKYVVGGLLLLGAAVGLWMMLQQPAPPPAEPGPVAAAPKPPERVNPMAEPELILEEEKDAGKPPVEEPQKPKQVRRGPARDEWDCAGDLQRAALQGVVDGNRAQIRNCYERRLKVNNVLQGDLKLRIRVGTNGQTSAVSVAGSLRDNEVFSCVRSIAQKWTFPPPSGGDCAVVQVPFQFSPKQ